MPVTKDQAHQIAALAIACRPVGAPRWDAAGVVAAIGKVAHLALADVIAAVTRAASDRTAETPGVIAATSSIHWRERVAERPTSTAPRLEDICHTCQRETCLCVDGPTRRPPVRAADDTRREAIESARRALRSQT